MQNHFNVCTILYDSELGVEGGEGCEISRPLESKSAHVECVDGNSRKWGACV